MDSVNSGDTSFLIVSTALVLLMTPGLAFFYGGLVRRKNVLNTMMGSFGSIGVAFGWQARVARIVSRMLEADGHRLSLQLAAPLVRPAIAHDEGSKCLVPDLFV